MRHARHRHLLHLLVLCAVITLPLAIWAWTSRVDDSANRVVNGTGPAVANILKGIGVAYDHDADDVWVVGIQSGDLGRLDLATNKVTQTYDLGLGTDHANKIKQIYFDNDRDTVWVLSFASSGSDIKLSAYNDGGTGMSPLYEVDLDPEYLNVCTAAPCGQVNLGAISGSNGHFYLVVPDHRMAYHYLLEYELTSSGSISYVDTHQVYSSTSYADNAITDIKWSTRTDNFVILARDMVTSEVYLTRMWTSGVVDHCKVDDSGRNPPVQFLAMGSNNEAYLVGRNTLIRTTAGNCNINWSRTVRGSSDSVGGGAESGRNVPKDIAYSETVVAGATYKQLGVLYTEDEGQVRAAPYLSWVDVYNVDTSPPTFTSSYPLDNPEGRSISGAIQSAAGSGSAFAVGLAGSARVGLVPSLGSSASLAQVGTSSEYLFVTPDVTYANRMVAVARLGGSYIVNFDRIAGTAGATHYFDQDDIGGVWPIGLTEYQAAGEMYTLTHYDRKFRVLNRDVLLGNTAGTLLTATVNLPAQTGRQAYQMSDTLSAFSSSADGMLHAALLNEQGELHIVDCRSAAASGGAYQPCHVDGSFTFGSIAVDDGPGRAQAAIKYDAASGAYSVLVYINENSSSQRELQVYQESTPGSGSWSLTYTTYLDIPRGTSSEPSYCDYPPTTAASDDYPVSTMHHSDSNDRLFLWDAVLDTSSMPPNCLGTIQSSPGVIEVNHVVAVQSVGTSSSTVWGVYLDTSTNKEKLKRVVYDSSYLTTGVTSDLLYDYNGHPVRSGHSMYRSGTSWIGMFSNAADGEVCSVSY